MTKGDLQQAAAVSQRHKMLWKDEILPQYEAEEKRFLINHAGEVSGAKFHSGTGEVEDCEKRRY